MASYLIVAIFSYLMGSIPFGYLLVKLFKGEDVRFSGSGNIGATNVARKSPALGVLTLLLDAAKGVVAVLLVKVFFSGEQLRWLMFTAAVFAVLGHMYPVWLKLRGGKGVATTLGAFLLLTPKTMLCLVALFMILTLTFRYVSFASITAAAAFPAFAWALREYSDIRQLLLVLLVGMLVIWKHRQNIKRLFAGTESKFGQKSANISSSEDRVADDRDPGSFGASPR